MGCKKGIPHRKWSKSEKLKLVKLHLEEHMSIREIERQYTKLDEDEQAIIDSRNIVLLLKQNAHRLSNARQIKKFVREAFSAAITDAVL